MEPRRRRATVGVMAKAPVGGAVKTRLLPALRPEEAADLARCFLLDTLDLVREVDAVRVVAYAPDEARAWFAELCPDFALIVQSGADLGTRMAGAFAALFAQGAGPIVLLGSDAPTLPSRHIRRALAILDRGAADVVLGPVEDGGYCLIGLAASQPALFTDVPWSTDAVLARTLERAQALALRVATLPSWWDVDTPADVRRLAAMAADDGGRARHTRAYLAARAAAGRGI